MLDEPLPAEPEAEADAEEDDDDETAAASSRLPPEETTCAGRINEVCTKRSNCTNMHTANQMPQCM